MRAESARQLENDLGRMELRFLAFRLGGQSQVAHLLKVNRSSVSRWLAKKLEPSQLVKIVGLNLILQKLLKVYKPELALDWLNGINAHLGNRKPVDLVRDGRIAEVMAALEQDETLAYA